MSATTDSAEKQGRVTFGPVFEGLFREYREKFSDRTIHRLVEAGIDPRGKLLAGYPYTVWYAAIRILAEEHHQRLAYPDGVREVGRAFMRGYFDTALGGAILAVLRILGPLRSLKRMSRNFRTGNNFSETWTYEDGPGNVRLEVNDCIADRPEFIQGLIEVGLESVGAKDSSVEVLSVHDNGHAIYRVRWSP
jgi:uncharacterized protein (TIGR02265 family)